MSADVSIGPAKSVPRVRVWDAPTRVTHWLMVLLFCSSWWSASHQQLDLHRYSGYALFGTVLFRVYWGLVGSVTARFAHFVKGPRTVWRYLRGTFKPTQPGHNPLGALSITALLVLLLTQVVLGLFSVDVDGLESGPLSRFVSFDTGRVCASLHHWVFNGLLVLIGLHVAAILFYRIVKRSDLIGPMISGWKRDAQVHGAASVLPAAWWRTALGMLIAASVVGFIARQ